MAARLEMQGLSELRAALRNLPEDLAAEADVIVQAQAAEAQRQIQQAYAEGPTGNLRRMVTRTKESSRYGSAALVRSRAPHSHLYERGSKPRKTATGANRGAMPEAPDVNRMIPIVVRRRRVMVEALIAMVRKAGFLVEGK